MSNEIIPSQQSSATTATKSVSSDSTAAIGRLAEPQSGSYRLQGELKLEAGRLQLSPARSESQSANQSTGHSANAGQAADASQSGRQSSTITLPANTSLPPQLKPLIEQALSQPRSSLPVTVTLKVEGAANQLTLTLPAQSAQLTAQLSLTQQQVTTLVNLLSTQSNGSYSRAELLQNQVTLSPAQLQTLVQSLNLNANSGQWQLSSPAGPINLPGSVIDALPAPMPGLPQNQQPNVDIVQSHPKPAATLGEALKQLAVTLRWQQPTIQLTNINLAKTDAASLLNSQPAMQQISLPLSRNTQGEMVVSLPNNKTSVLPKALQNQLAALAMQKGKQAMPSQLVFQRIVDGFQVKLPALQPIQNTSAPPANVQPQSPMNSSSSVASLPTISPQSVLGKALAALLPLGARQELTNINQPLLISDNTGKISFNQAITLPGIEQTANQGKPAPVNLPLLQHLLPLLAKGSQPLESSLQQLAKLLSPNTNAVMPSAAQGAKPNQASNASQALPAAVTEKLAGLLSQIPKSDSLKPEQIQQWIKQQLSFQPFNPLVLANSIAAVQGQAVSPQASDTLGMILSLLFSGKIGQRIANQSGKTPLSGKAKADAATINQSYGSASWQAAQKSIGQIAQTTQFQQAQSSDTQTGTSYFSLPIAEGQLFKQVEGRIDRFKDESKDKPDAEKVKSWQLTLKLDVGSYGELLAQARLAEQQLKIKFTASKGNLKRLVDNHLTQLDDRLQNMGFQTELASRQGRVPATLMPQANQLVEVKV
ncbi:flagellar hook-length control protein FliK [Corallincola platygyrae]|uniref:Flagellar hook-length control protein FliK n=1 Tax=Corallincola platygyrae TaxID=1193278 RepID=A0ABW4XKK3_9GAMM